MDGHDGADRTERPSGMGPVGRLTLVRSGHRWSFECGLGDGAAFGRRLNELASSPDCTLRPEDASLIGLRIAGALADDFSKLMGGASR